MKRIVNKHMQARFHSIVAYILSVTVVSLPLAALDTIIFGTLVYWMTNFDHDFPRFLFYLLIIFLVGITFNSFFRVIAFLSPSLVRKHSTIAIIGLQCQKPHVAVKAVMCPIICNSTTFVVFQDFSQAASAPVAGLVVMFAGFLGKRFKLFCSFPRIWCI